VLAGVIIAVTGLIMVALHPFSATLVLRATRLVVASGVIASLTFAIIAIGRRDITGHRAWMWRAYALIMGAGTQAVVSLTYILAFGPPTAEAQDLILALCWPLNLALVELALRHRPGYFLQLLGKRRRNPSSFLH
jgi:hypothetical protein